MRIHYRTFTFSVLIAFLIIGCQPDFSELNIIENYIHGLETAKQINKPILLMFSAFGLGDRRFENDFATSSRIQKIINDEFVFIYLVVDDKRKMNDEYKQSVLKLLGQEEDSTKLRHTGDLNYLILDKQYSTKNFPFYFILDSENNEVLEQFGYIGNRDNFYEKLYKGLERVKE